MKTEIESAAAKAVSRRDFLRSTAAVTSFLVVESSVLGREGHISPNEKLNIAGIGVGGQGGSDLAEMTSEKHCRTLRCRFRSCSQNFR
jgi:hypothetical protein